MNYFEDIGFDQLPKYPVSMGFSSLPSSLDTVNALDNKSPTPSVSNHKLNVEGNHTGSGGIIVIVLIAIGILGFAAWASNKTTLKAANEKD